MNVGVVCSFQITNRVTINYPLQQKHVVRVKPSIQLSQLFELAVRQKNLDPLLFELQHPTQPGLVLDLSMSLSQYAITEVVVVAKRDTTSPAREFVVNSVIFVVRTSQLFRTCVAIVKFVKMSYNLPKNSIFDNISNLQDLLFSRGGDTAQKLRRHAEA